MIINEYQELSKRTMNPDGDVHNYIFGLIGESGEVVDKIKKLVFHKHPLDDKMTLDLKEEIGDNFWYVSSIATIFKLNMSELFNGIIEDDYKCNIKHECFMLNIVVSRITKQFLHKEFYNDGLVLINLIDNLTRFVYTLRLICNYYNFDVYEILEQNVEKLKRRYKGDGFTPNESINRK